MTDQPRSLPRLAPSRVHHAPARARLLPRLLGLAACWLGAAALLLPPSAQAQGLRMPGASGSGLQMGGMAGSASAGRQGGPAPFANDLRDAASNAVASSAGQASGGQRQADFIVALVNSEPITHVELQNRMQRARAVLAQQGQSPSESALRQEVLNLLIAERLQLQEAKQSKLQVDDYTLDQAEQNVAEQNGVSLAAMHQELAAAGIDRAQFRNQLRNQIMLMRVREHAVEARVRVSDQELDRYLRERPIDAGQQLPDAINLGHVLVIVPEKATPAQQAQYKQRIEQAASQLAQGRDFAEVAREFSDAGEASRGGELGLRPVTQYPELFLQATAGRAIGEVAGPIRSGAGYHLLKVLERQAGGAGMVMQNHARHILIKPAPGRSAQSAGQMLQEIRQRVVQGGEDFAVLAREYSEDGSAAQGGDLGWAGPGMFVPEFQAVLDELQPGEVSQPVVSRFGLHLIQLLDRRQRKVSQSELREMVRGQVREQKVQEAFVKWIDGLRARAFIEMRDEPVRD
ncbi:molecular chaperone SurA [Vandammella animalimorsus]|uniref:Chaperone SurA n=1 Tax=Vandammella animalimorsus TaxID=2029117 RepID=A0A3M6RHX1_9BURK|nr:peptidylprolyl isomerase [Vandammella animalimorsus]RMX14855.1 molecular chaperone SurA [Vandammella animalimorsus]